MGERINLTLVKTLEKVPALASLDDRAVLQLVGASANLVWEAGSTVFNEGSPAEALYVILSGKISIRASGGEAEAPTEVAVIGPGDFFGELSILRDTVHTKTARTLERCELLVLPRESFQELLNRDLDFGDYVGRIVERRLPAAGDSSRT